MRAPDATVVYSNDKVFNDLLTGALSINKAILTGKLKVLLAEPCLCGGQMLPRVGVLCCGDPLLPRVVCAHPCSCWAVIVCGRTVICKRCRERDAKWLGA